VKVDTEPAISVLRAETDSLTQQIDLLVAKRESLLNSIALLEQGDGGRVKGNVEQQGAAHVLPAREGFRRNSSGQPSLAALLDGAGRAQSGNFTVSDLAAHLLKHYPERRNLLTPDDLSKHVYVLRHRGKFILVKKAAKKKGKKNVYRYNHNFPEKK